jgi:glycosyltransferase involved in cell wall biosynthesis
VPRFSIITTCKGRLHHLKESLPRFLQQRDTEVIVVDYDCPDRTADYVHREYPEAKVVAITDAPVFNISHARNLGAATAVGDWLVFLDADVMAAPNMLERVVAIIQAGRRYYRFRSGNLALFGNCVVRRSHFREVQGYDAVIQGYGGEDNEFYERLERNRVVRDHLEEGLIESSFDHSPEDRVRFYKRKSLLLSIRINAAYRVVKFALLQQYGVPELPEDVRRSTYVLVRRAVKTAHWSGQAHVRIEAPLPDDHAQMPFSEWEAKRKLVFDLNLKQTATEAEMQSGGGLAKFLRE